MNANPDLTKELMTDNIQSYLDALQDKKTIKPEITETGKIILKYMQDCGIPMLKSKDIAEGLYISSRKVSGSIRKLVTDGFCEKIGESPALYLLTEKGKNYNIIIEDEKD